MRSINELSSSVETGQSIRTPIVLSTWFGQTKYVLCRLCAPYYQDQFLYSKYRWQLVHRTFKSWAICAVGLPKFFRVTCFKLQTWVWLKSWRYTKFQVPPGMFDYICRAPKLEHLQACWPVVDTFGALGTWSNVPGGTWNLVYLQDLGQSQVWSLKHETPKNLGSPTQPYFAIAS